MTLTFTGPLWADEADLSGTTNRMRRPIEELFKSDVVYPEEQGEFEMELVSLYQNQHGGLREWILPLSMEYGLTDSWQIEAEWNALCNTMLQVVPFHAVLVTPKSAVNTPS